MVSTTIVSPLSAFLMMMSCLFFSELRTCLSLLDKIVFSTGLSIGLLEGCFTIVNVLLDGCQILD